MTTQLKPNRAALSAIEVEVLDGFDPDIEDEYQAIRDAWDGRFLTVSAANVDALDRALTELSNYFDDRAVHPERDMSAYERRFAKRAVAGLALMFAPITQILRDLAKSA